MADKLKDSLMAGTAKASAPLGKVYQHQTDAMKYLDAAKADAEVKVVAAQLPRSLAMGDYRTWIDEMLKYDDAKARHLREQYRASYPPQQIVQHPPTPAPTVEDFKTADLVMEMLKRGYAVIKMPEDGSLPGTLK